MDLGEVERLIAELKASGIVNHETLEDLDGFLASARRGDLRQDDAKFLGALHDRLLGHKANKDERHGQEPATPGDWQARALRAEAELSRLRATSGEVKFAEIKKRFAKRYHPNSGNYSGIEAAIRAEIFKEFGPRLRMSKINGEWRSRSGHPA